MLKTQKAVRIRLRTGIKMDLANRSISRINNALFCNLHELKLRELLGFRLICLGTFAGADGKYLRECVTDTDVITYCVYYQCFVENCEPNRKLKSKQALYKVK